MNKFCFFLFVLIFAQCQLFKKPEEPTLPPPTQEGANKAGCYMNKVLWLSGNRNLYFIYDSARSNTIQLVINGTLRNSSGPYINANILVSLEDTQIKQLAQLPLLNNRTYPLGTAHKASLYFSQPLEATSGSITFTSVKQSQIKSVWDYTQQKTFYIVAGTFEFTTSQQKVTQGRFDFSVDERLFQLR